MTRQEHLMVCLIEECNETVHALSKCLRFGPDEIWPKMDQTNMERVSVELNDLLAVAAMLVDEGFDLDVDLESAEAKKAKVEKYIKYAEFLGTIEKS